MRINRPLCHYSIAAQEKLSGILTLILILFQPPISYVLFAMPTLCIQFWLFDKMLT